MKVAPYTTKGFKPFTITVESRDEANYLAALVGATSGAVTDLFGLDSNEQYKVWLALKSHTNSLPYNISVVPA